VRQETSFLFKQPANGAISLSPAIDDPHDSLVKPKYFGFLVFMQQ
jgi:spore cortex formation protein SpoVR/YcgB (stage V sporulation)